MDIAIILFLIILKGIFSMAEVAFISVKKNRFKKGNSKTKSSYEFASTSNFFSVIELGTIVALILIGIFCSNTLFKIFLLFITQNEILLPYSVFNAISNFIPLIAIVLATFFTLIFGELIPKKIGSIYPEIIYKFTITPIKYLSIVITPFIRLSTRTADLLLKFFRVKPLIEGKIKEGEIKAIIKEGEVQEIEQDIVERVFHIGDRKVNSLMTHRKSVISLPLNASKEKIKELVFNNLHSAYPVYGKNYDDIIGVVRLRHLFSKFEKEKFNLKSILTEASFIMEQTPAYKALEYFKENHIHYALVSDEYGIFQGIITLNDILGALIGNTSDFYEEDFQLVEIEEGTWLVDGHYSFHNFLIFFGLDNLISEYNVITVSGLIITQLSHIPETGEKLIWEDYELEVVEMDGVKIDKVKVRTINPEGSYK